MKKSCLLAAGLIHGGKNIMMKKIISLIICLSLIAVPVYGAEDAAPQTEMETEQESTLEGQLTLEEISALNGGEEKVFMHNDRVTMVDGTCTDGPVESMKDAAAVGESMMTLIGADAETKFAPWREIMDPMGHHYYIFQQVYEDTTVCGGAVKVITDEDGNMIALTSNIETRMPDVESGERISASGSGADCCETGI